jgi:hypothetical protein
VLGGETTPGHQKVVNAGGDEATIADVEIFAGLEKVMAGLVRLTFAVDGRRGVARRCSKRYFRATSSEISLNNLA